MQLYDKAGRKLVLRCSNVDGTVNGGEVWEPNTERVVRTLTATLSIAWLKAMELLIESTIENPVLIDNEMFWVEVENKRAASDNDIAGHKE